MDKTRFIDLALRRLENPADGELREAVETALGAHPEWLKAWQALRDGHTLHREAGLAAAELAMPPPAEEIPPVPWAKLGLPPTPDFSPRQGPRWRWLIGLVAAAMIVIATTFGLRDRTTSPVDLVPLASPGLARYLTAPLPALLATATTRVQRAPAAIWLRSPIIAARAGPVEIAWVTTENNARYDVTLFARGRVIWAAEDVQSPVTTTDLATDGVYEIQLIPAAGSNGSREKISARFITVATATQSVPSLPGIVSAASAEPARLGEAVNTWWLLPAKDRTSEAGTRVGLWLGVEARQPDLLAEAQRQAAMATGQ